jgi:hypothetical protein
MRVFIHAECRPLHFSNPMAAPRPNKSEQVVDVPAIKRLLTVASTIEESANNFWYQ